MEEIVDGSTPYPARFGLFHGSEILSRGKTGGGHEWQDAGLDQTRRLGCADTWDSGAAGESAKGLRECVDIDVAQGNLVGLGQGERDRRNGRTFPGTEGACYGISVATWAAQRGALAVIGGWWRCVLNGEEKSG